MSIESIAVTDRKITNVIRGAMNEHYERLANPLWESKPMANGDLPDKLPRFRCAPVPVSNIDKVFEKDEKSRIVAFAEIETELSPSEAMSILRKKINETNAGLGMEVLGIKFNIKESDEKSC